MELKWKYNGSEVARNRRSSEHQSTNTPELKTRRLDLHLASYKLLTFDLHSASYPGSLICWISIAYACANCPGILGDSSNLPFNVSL